MASYTPVYNPEIMPYPSELDDVLHGHKLKDGTYESIEAINKIVRVTKDLGSLDENYDVKFINGGYTDIVLNLSLKQILEDEPARVTLKLIELFHLDAYFDLEKVTAELKSLTEKEMKEILK
ncbi:hypothetical protein QTV49_004550 [Vibrio vulnificus]|nr:hypothetical protein [Vibrio vulnificus]